MVRGRRQLSARWLSSRQYSVLANRGFNARYDSRSNLSRDGGDALFVARPRGPTTLVMSSRVRRVRGPARAVGLGGSKSPGGSQARPRSGSAGAARHRPSDAQQHSRLTASHGGERSRTPPNPAGWTAPTISEASRLQAIAIGIASSGYRAFVHRRPPHHQPVKDSALISRQSLDQLPVSLFRCLDPCYGRLSPSPKWGMVPWNSPVNVRNLAAPAESNNTTPRVAVN